MDLTSEYTAVANANSYKVGLSAGPAEIKKRAALNDWLFNEAEHYDFYGFAYVKTTELNAMKARLEEIYGSDS